MTKISSRYVSARSGSVARSSRAAGTASRVKVARIVIASRAVNSPLSTFDAVWMTCSTATRTTRHYEAAAGAQTNASPGAPRRGDQEHPGPLIVPWATVRSPRPAWLTSTDQLQHSGHLRSAFGSQHESVRTQRRGRHPATARTMGAQSAVVGRRPYDRGVAHASPSPTPNPDAMKFTLDITLPATAQRGQRRRRSRSPIR